MARRSIAAVTAFAALVGGCLVGLGRAEAALPGGSGRFVAGRIFYQLGRIATYCLLGVVAEKKVPGVVDTLTRLSSVSSSAGEGAARL